MSEQTLASVVARLHRAEVRLELGTTDICFLAALDMTLRTSGRASLEEAAIRDVYAFASEVAEPGAPAIHRRATVALERLRAQRLLARVDGSGLVRAGDWTLTRLATGIIHFYLDDAALTRQSLLVLCSTLRATLRQVLDHALAGGDDAFWEERVRLPLQVTVSDLVAGIDGRQRGLDDQQADVRTKVATLLSDRWAEALDTCEALLDETARTLHELSEVLLVETGQIADSLDQILQAAAAADRRTEERIARSLGIEVLRVGAWGSDRLDAWEAWFSFAQRYLRGVVRLDPARGTSQRLRDGIRSWSGCRWTLRVATVAPLRALRLPEARLFVKPIVRPRKERDRPPRVEVLPPPPVDIRAVVDELLASGPTRLSDVLERVLPLVAADEHFRTAGEAVEVVAWAGLVERPRDEAWSRMSESMTIQDLRVRRRLRPVTPKGEAS